MMAKGASEAEALRRNWLVDSRGLVVKGRSGLTEHKLRYAHDQGPIGDFLTAINTLKPTAIIGVAAVGGAFTPEVLQTMARINDRPIVFALSNPTSKAECSAEEAYRHTGGRALFACGSPYDPVKLGGKTFVPRQGNNSYIFPGVGLGAIASGARLVTDEMFMAAAHTLAHLVSEATSNRAASIRRLPRIREVSAHIAAAVAEVAYKRGLATGQPAEGSQRIHSIADVRPTLFELILKQYSQSKEQEGAKITRKATRRDCHVGTQNCEFHWR